MLCTVDKKKEINGTEQSEGEGRAREAPDSALDLGHESGEAQIKGQWLSRQKEQQRQTFPRRKPKPQAVSKDSLLRSRAGPPHGLSEKALMHTYRATTYGETRPSRPRAPSTCLECAVSSGEARNERPSGSAVLSRGVS